MKVVYVWELFVFEFKEILVIEVFDEVWLKFLLFVIGFILEDFDVILKLVFDFMVKMGNLYFWNV